MAVKFKTINIHKVLFTLAIFLYLYMPPIIPVNTIYLIGALGWGYILLNGGVISKEFAKKFLDFIGIAIYIVIVGYIKTGGLITSMAGLFYLAFFGIPAALSVGLYAMKHKFTIEDLIKIIAWAATLQGILSIFSYLFYGVQSFFVGRFYLVMDSAMVDHLRNKRLYGWANGMTYGMPVVQGVIGIIVLIYALKKEKRYLILVPIIWLAGIFNARTSILIILLGLVIVLLENGLLNWKRLFQLLLIVIFGVVVLNLVLKRSSNTNSSAWLSSGINEIVAFLKGKNIGYFALLHSNTDTSIGITTFPSGNELWFGTGELVRSDIGYVRDMWEGGILYCLLLYSLFLSMIKKIFLSLIVITRKRTSFFICIFFVVVMIIANIKGSIFGLNELALFLILTYFSLTLYNKNGVLKKYNE